MRPRWKHRSLIQRKLQKKRRGPFNDDLWISEATRADWPYFARWHYRSHAIGLSRFMTLLWHSPEPDPVTGETDARPIGICVFVSPPMSLGPRNQFFGRRGRWTSLNLKAMNRQLCLLQRVVLHPTYRGAGIAAAFIRRSCELCPFPWIETLTQLGNTHPVFERAGFQRVGPVQRTSKQTQASHAQIFGRRCPDGSRTITRETFEKSRFGRPMYYVFDNRREEAGCVSSEGE